MEVLEGRARSNVAAADPYSPWAAGDAWRMNLPGEQIVSLRHGEVLLSIAVSHRADGVAVLRWDGREQRVRRVVRSAGRALIVTMERSGEVAVVREGDRFVAVVEGANHVFDLVDPLAPPAAAIGGGGKILAPIPGRIASVLVAVGDAVARGQKLVVLEAMKMELALTAPADGTVAAVRCGVGDMVEEGREVVVVEP
jgi:3-methylcrotonyl-CoA carboxylase alpha subunit